MVVIVMGVSGAGKSTIAALLAAKLDAAFLEGDRFHPPANVAKMAAGIPLDDADRLPWLDRLAAKSERLAAQGRPVVLACSALKAAYRTRLGMGRPDHFLVYLRGSIDEVAARLAGRRGHFMPPTLLDSQFRALEEPADGIVADIAETPDAIVARIVETIAKRQTDRVKVPT